MIYRNTLRNWFKIYTSDTATSDSFTFKVNDGTVDSDDAATVGTNIAAVNDTPVATAQTVEATEQTEKTITLAGTDADGDELSYIVISIPENGILKDNGTEITTDDLLKQSLMIHFHIQATPTSLW